MREGRERDARGKEKKKKGAVNRCVRRREYKRFVCYWEEKMKER
jgi:hypothetical protein